MDFVQSIAELPYTGLEASLALLDVFEAFVLHRLDDINLRDRVKVLGVNHVKRWRFEGRVLIRKFDVDVYARVTFIGKSGYLDER